MKKFITVLLIVATLGAMVIGMLTVRDKGKKEGLSVFWTDDIDAFSKEITIHAESDKEKVSAFYSWITENIRYDYEADMLYQYFDIGRTLQTKKGICFDYASLFAALCRSQGIPCYIVDGYSRENFSYKHTWNRVYYDGAWWNLDVTYDAIQIQKNSDVLYGFRNIGTNPEVEDDVYVITRIY